VNVVWDSESAAREFVREFKLSFPVGRDASAAIGTPYRVDATPANVFIDRAGVLVERKTGGLSQEEFERRIEKLLAG